MTETNLEHYKKELEKILNGEFANTSVVFDKVKKNCDSNIRSCCWTTYTRDILDWMSQPYKEPILEEDERNYLSNVIRPFKENVCTVYKRKFYSYSGLTYEYIVVKLRNDKWGFPKFVEGTMYKGMEVNKEYSLEELGL